MTNEQARSRLMGMVSASFIPMEEEVQLVAFLDRALTALTWIRPEEKLPKVFQRVLICREKEPGQLIVEQGFLDVGEWWKVYGTRVRKIHAWMPMPEPLKKG